MEPAAVWVVHDELALPLCRLRINRGGSGAGHNGVLSVMRPLGTPDFPRFRVGIGKPPVKAGARHLLGPFTKAEVARLDKVVGGVADALQVALDEGLDPPMEPYNR